MKTFRSEAATMKLEGTHIVALAIVVASAVGMAFGHGDTAFGLLLAAIVVF